MTFPLKLNLSLLFLLSLFLFPFPTFAATGNHGSICEGPDDDNQTCLFDKTKGQPTVHLKWDLSAKGITGPAISCWLTSGTSTDVVADDNTNDHDGYENDKIRVPSTNRYYKTTDPDPLISPVGYINPTTIPQNAIRFQAKDDVYVYPPEATTTVYTVHCCTAVNGPAWPGCHLRDPQSVTRTVVAKEACEVPFGAIKENLKNGEPTHITESNLKSWVETTQDLDYSKNGSGSGDSRDISDYLISNQRDYRGCTGNGSDGVCITQLFLIQKLFQWNQ
ncbi:MAG: hypothetical protein NT041_01475 [Candidatus Vogelbacteria bacterium]|nr:hypothetical protein [Candidatus Vogelbacteria bacterium]